MRADLCLRLAAILAGLAVVLGAFAAHAMQPRYEAAQLQTFETAVRYQMYHALALLGCGVLSKAGYRSGGAAACFVLGIVLFSGSLYVLVLSGAKWLGAVTPFGGGAFVVGWALLAWRVGGARAPSVE